MSINCNNAARKAISAVACICLAQFVAMAQVERRRDLPVRAETKTVESKAVERTTKGNTTDLVAHFEDTKVSLTGSTFTLTFYAAPGLVPKVEIGTAAPVQRDETWVFRDGSSAGEGNAFASNGSGPLGRKVGTIANTFYTFESSMFNVAPLEPGTSYYYVLSIPAEGSARQHQTTGSFTTPNRNVTVVFETVKIINDGDPDPPWPLPPDCGEIALWFWANYGLPSAKFMSVPKLGRGDVGACSDHLYDIKRELTLWNAPNILTLSVSGRDTDRGNYAGEDVLGPFEPAPIEEPRDTGEEELNGVSAKFNLTRIAAGEVKRFTLVSKPADGGRQGDLMFSVSGYLRVSYPQP